MPNARAHDTITFALIPFTYLGAEMYWDDPTTSAIATLFMVFSGYMFGPDLDLDSKPYRRWGPLRYLWKPYQAALPHRSTLSHGPMLGTVIRIAYFLIVFGLFAVTLLFFRQRYVYGVQTTWETEYEMVKADLFAFWGETPGQYLWAAFAGLWVGALGHTTADILWSTFKRKKRRRRSYR